MPSSDDDEDYMSDKFLQSDHKPGLMPDMFKNKHKRVESARVKNQPKTKPVKQYEAEKREEKLNTALDESNKGFAMLAKMGFKKGMGLGKKEQGISNPIPLDIKEGRKGLGKESEEARRKKQRIEAHLIMAKRRKLMEENLKGDFKSRVTDRINERQIATDLYKSQKACQHLDNLKGLEPIHTWSWPKYKTTTEEEEEEEVNDEIEDDEPEDVIKLNSLTAYLRETHFYCIWCGTAYNDSKDLNDNCPGATFEAHEE